MMNYDTRQLEREALSILRSSVSDPLLRPQLVSANIVRREASTAGVFIDFNVPVESASKDPGSYTLELHGTMEELKSGFGVMVSIEKGMLRCIECFTFGEIWPANPTNLKVAVG